METKNQFFSSNDQESVSLLIEHQVRGDALNDYEVWLKKVSEVVRQFEGHLSVDIIRPHDASGRYAIFIRFGTYQQLKGWIDSDIRRDFLAGIRSLLISTRSELHNGIDFWFTPHTATPLRARPLKQFLLTLSAIFPLVLLVPMLLSPALNRVGLQASSLPSQFMTIALIVYIMVYLVMPRYTRLVGVWLFK